MGSPRPERAARWLQTCIALAVGGGVVLGAAGAHAQGFGGRIDYTGKLGPISAQRPLCLCLYTDAQLLDGIGCLISRQNTVRYSISRPDGDYYLVAFVDLHLNEQLDPDEPFEIYRDRAAPPADPVSTASGAMDIDFIFGDENLPGASTPTPSATPSLAPSPSPSASPTESPSPQPTATPSATPTTSATATASSVPTLLPCDCDGDGTVAIDELVRGVAIALAMSDVEVCPPADINGDAAVTVDELVRAVNAALRS